MDDEGIGCLALYGCQTVGENDLECEDCGELLNFGYPLGCLPCSTLHPNALTCEDFKITSCSKGVPSFDGMDCIEKVASGCLNSIDGRCTECKEDS